jgi:hypothetical protein
MDALKSMLETAGYEVMPAITGGQALHLLTTLPIDAVLLNTIAAIARRRLDQPGSVVMQLTWRKASCDDNLFKDDAPNRQLFKDNGPCRKAQLVRNWEVIVCGYLGGNPFSARSKHGAS